MLSFDDALRRVTATTPASGTESVPAGEAVGRVLAKPLIADRDLPPFDRSERDGFAARASDFDAGKATLRIEGETIFAGMEPSEAVAPGTCVRIMTGAPMPVGANVAVPVEKTAVQGGVVEVDYTAVAPGLHVHFRGSDAAGGDVLIPDGTLLGPSQLAVAYSVGASRVEVHRKIRVALLSTGDELVGIEDSPSPAQIRDCNGPGNRALLGSHPWLEVVLHRRVPDDEEALRESITAALDCADALILSGGVSMGDKDLVPGALEACGVAEEIHNIAIRPGKPFWLGRSRNGQMVFGLPGNPVAVQVTTRELVIPALRKMAGFRRIIPTPLYLPLSEHITKKLPLRQFVVSRFTGGSGESTVAPLKHNGSGDFVSTALADGVIVLPEGELDLAPGDAVRFHLWREP